MLLSKLRTAVIFLFLMIAVINTTVTYLEYQNIRRGIIDPVFEPGYEFADLRHFLSGKRAIGYLTDLDISPESLNTQNFLSAQFALAPVVLDVGNKNPRWILIDASDPYVAFNLAEELNAIPVFYNPYSKLLIRRR